MPCLQCQQLSTEASVDIALCSTNFGHYGLAIVALHIAERHAYALARLGAILGVDRCGKLDVGSIDVADVVESSLSTISVSWPGRRVGMVRGNLLFPWTTNLVTRAAVSVVICSVPSLRPEKPTLRSSLVLSSRSVRSATAQLYSTCFASEPTSWWIISKNPSKEEERKHVTVLWTQVLLGFWV